MNSLTNSIVEILADATNNGSVSFFCLTEERFFEEFVRIEPDGSFHLWGKFLGIETELGLVISEFFRETDKLAEELKAQSKLEDFPKGLEKDSPFIRLMELCNKDYATESN